MLPAPPCYAPTEQTKDSLSRWLPTIVAIIGIVAQGFYLGQRLGAAEQKLDNTTITAHNNVSRVEYLSDKAAQADQLSDLKQALRDINNKLDRLVERQTTK